jgi:hypothetical protein
MSRLRSALAALLVFAAGVACGGWLACRYMEARDEERAQAAWSLMLVVEQQPNRAELWQAWRAEFKAARERR